MKTLLITGGAGFIGSHVVRRFVNKYPDYKIVNLDVLTYAGNLENLRDIDTRSNYEFVKADINDGAAMNDLFEKYQFDGVLHLAAESHVDRSIADPMAFIMTNIVGTVNLLNAARKIWNNGSEGHRFYHISTDEVMALWVRAASSWKQHPTIRTALILLPKRVLTIWYGPITTPINCLL